MEGEACLLPKGALRFRARNMFAPEVGWLRRATAMDQQGRGDALVENKPTDSVFMKPPLHMNKEARNERLFETLLGMGLFVQPIPDGMGHIDCFLVSTGMPAYVPQAQG